MWLWVGLAFGADWGTTIDRVVGSVVVLRYERPRAFDGGSSSAPQASGFIVDAERGIILTNRHVVGTGPQVAHALFPNQEEIPIEPLYADPIHDFGFYRYDPALVKQNKPVSLPLVPEGARMGREIRLIGNDAGEQISILDGTISRIDRPAPWWDMNTFYVQAASDSSGGSSGSPVFDIDGQVIALNAGGRTRESTSYYLRLERVKVALEALQRDLIPTRGTLQTEFTYRPFDEVKRLGLSDEDIAAARARWDGTGMLVVATVGREGPGAGALRPGDVLVSLQGAPIFEFATLEAILDSQVGGTVEVEVERGGERLAFALPVRDLHTLAPREFLTFAEGSFHAVSFKDTLRHNRAPIGVVIASPGPVFSAANIPSNSVLETIDGRPVPTLDALQEVLLSLRIGQVASVVYTSLTEPGKRVVGRIRMVDNVIPNERCTSERAVWTCVAVAHPVENVVVERARVEHTEVTHKPARAVAKRLVMVSSESALPLDSTVGAFWASAGLVVDAEKGLVLTDRYAVPNEASRVSVQAGDGARVPAEIVHLDPLFNTAVVRYDPALLDFGELAPIVWSDDPPREGAKYWTAVIDDDGNPYSLTREFTRWEELSLGAVTNPKFRADNLEVLKFGKFERSSLGGVVVDKKGRIVSLYQNFSNEVKRKTTRSLFGIETWAARQALAKVMPLYNGIEIRRVSLAKAREAGLSVEIADRLRRHRPQDPIVLEVWRVDASVETSVQVGDFIVTVNGQEVSTFGEMAAQTTPSMVLEVVRDGVLTTASATPVELGGSGQPRLVRWAGAWVQEEPIEVSRESGTPKKGVYLSWFYGGSPAQRYNLGYGRRITAIDGTAVNDLDGFLAAVKGLENGESVRVGLQSLKGVDDVITVVVDNTWWPTLDVVRDGGVWTRRD